MAPRVNARHTTCPGCQQEVFLEELVSGRCPLCGCDLEDTEEVCEGFDDVIDRSDLAWLLFHYFLYRKFEAMGASPVQTLSLINRCEGAFSGDTTPRETAYELDVPMALGDRVRLKRCSSCGRLFLFGGKKRISGDLARAGDEIRYTCRNCRSK
jgi:hypothetical protein